MPEIKNTFVQGKMNQDLDERIVPNGQYIDAMNIKVTSSDDASVGVVQNILGNYRVEGVIPPGSGYICIATIADEKTNKLYWFVTKENPTIHAILEYDLKTEDTKFVLVDKKNDTLKFTQNIITGVNIIDNLLFWTDNYSEPKKINIDNCIQGTDQNVTTLDNAVHTRLVVDGIEKNDISEKNITVIKKSPKQPPSITVNEPTTTNTPRLFEQVFPRFSFRYRYEDGEYSSFGPFTDVVFNPVYTENFNIDNFYSIKESYNTAMINHIESIEISNFISSSTPEDVTQVEILYKEDGSPTVYSIKTIDHEDIDWTNNEYTLESESIFAAIPSNQFLRPWDNVPKKALAQEITGNRIVYANYTQGYDLLAWNSIKVGNKINASFGLRENNITFNEGGLPSLKTQRNYQVGFVWGDKYGRETPVFTSEEGGVNIPWYENTLGLLASQSLFLKTNLATFIPTWADYYKFYVKETSGDYYNLIMTKAYAQTSLNVFDEEEDRVWLAFPSADRNKVTEDDYLILKRKETRQQVELQNKFKILDISNEAPDGVKFEYVSLGEANQNQLDGGVTRYLEDNGNGGALFDNADKRIDKLDGNNEGVDTVHVRRDSWINVTGGGSLTKDGDNENMYVDNIYIMWKSSGQNSEKYKVVSIFVLNDVYQIKLNRKITELDALAAQETDDINYSNFDLKHDLVFSCERKIEKDLDEFSGKFFVQIVVSNSVKKQQTTEELLENFSVAAARPIHWFMDDEAGSADPSLGIINARANTVGLDTNSKSHFITSISSGATVGYTDVDVDWSTLAGQLNTNKQRGFFIDNMAFAAGQSDNNNFAKGAGETWKGWGAFYPVNPTWTELTNSSNQFIGEYGWTMSGLTGGNPNNTGYEVLDPAYYSPRPFAGLNYSVDETKNINGLEGFIETDESHVTDVNGFATSANYRVWKNYDIRGSVYASNPYGSETGKYFMHISFLGPGKDLVSDDAFDNLSHSDVKTFGQDSVGNFMQGIWGGGVFSDPTANGGAGVIVEMEGNYDEFDEGLPGTPRVGVGQGYSTDNDHKEKHDNQWDPLFGDNDNNDEIEDFLNNLKKDKQFRFASNGDFLNSEEEVFTIKKVTTKKLYNHTPWKAQYKWDGSGTVGSVKVGDGLVTCGNSVDEAAIAWAETINSGNINGNIGEFNSFKDTVIRFGKRHNRRLVYIIELDKDPTALAITGGSTAPDVDSPVDIEFITTDPNSVLKNIIQKPAIWETEAKPSENLDLYYEASQAIPIYLTDETNELFAPVGSKVEILLSEARNGEFIINDDILLESWNSNKEITLSGSGFNKKGVSGSNINYVDAQIRFFRPDGSYTTTKIVSVGDGQDVDSDGIVDYIKTITLDTVLDASMEQGLSYFNCYSFGDGIESNRIRDDFNAPSISKGVKASLVLDQEYKEENRKNGLIYSGIYNSTSGINNLNQFIMAEKITKDLNPTYGSIQKLFQRRISLVAFCEDRTISITSNKDALFNADGNSQLVSTNNVLGDATPFVGDFGISQNPESFAKETYRAYFTDKQRGAVLRLSMDGITPISNAGMDDYFRDNLKLSGEIIGSYDSHSKNYNVTLKGSKPGDNIVANNSIDVGFSSINFLTPTNVVIDGDTNVYTPISSPTIDVTNNIYQNGNIIVETTITNYDEIGVGDLIQETETITTTTDTLTTFAATSSSLFYSHSINDSDNPLTGNGQDNYTAATTLSGGFDDNMDLHLYPIFHPPALYTPTTQRSDSDKFWSGQNFQYAYNHGPSRNIFWQYEADDYEDGVFSLESQFLGTLNYTNNANGWQMGPPSAGQPWFYAGTGVTAGYRGFIWDGIFESGSTNQPTLTLPGNRDADGNANDDLLLGQISTEYPNARNNTMFNGEEVKISFYFKHDPDLNQGGTNTYSGPNGNTPRFVQILLYDGIPGEGGTPVNPDNILDTASLPNGVTSSDYATYSQAPSTSTYQLGYQTDRFVSFAEVDSANNKLHVAYFKFTNEDEVEGICINDLQIGFRVMNGDDGFGDRIYGYTYGNLGSVNIEKVFRLEECFTETTTSTSDGNPVPDTLIPAFTTVTHSLPNWSLFTPGGTLNSIDYTSAAITEYGTEFSDLTTYTLTQSGSGATETYVFPTSGNEDNGTTAYNTVANGIYTTDDKLNIDNTHIIISQGSLSLLVDDWYFVDLIYNSYTPGTDDTVIKSPGNNTSFEEIQTDIHGTSGQNVLRAIFQINFIQGLYGVIQIAVGSDTAIEIEEIKLIQINDPITGGNMTHWNFNTDPNPSQHSFDMPSLYGSGNGIQFNVISPLNGSTIVRSATQELYQRNIPSQTSLVPTNDGYELKFTITNYEPGSGALQFIVGNGNTNNGLSSADHGALRIGLGGTITQDGNYSVEFNFSDDMSGYDIKRDGDSTGDFTASANQFENKILIKNSNSGFIGSISDISLIDLTNYFTGAGFDSFNVSGFDQDNYNYIDFEDLGNNQSQIVFNNSPILGGTSDQIQIEQLINKTIRQEEMYRLVFDYNISSGSIGVYYFSSLGDKGFKRIDITGSGTFNELITINEDHAGSDLLNTLVFFVNEVDTTGTIDNIVLRQEFLQAKTSTLSFSENAKGWVSKKSFIPEQGVSISNEYFTMDKGRLYEHNSDIEVRNTFYGKYEPSTITAVLNQSPSSIKSFNTLNYEGSQSNIIAGDGNVLNNGNTYSTLSTYNLNKSDGWSVDYIKTDKQEGSLDEFIEKEGKWFNYIKGLSTNVKTSDLSFQGLGIVKTIN